jgi:hypothetical protein
VLYDFDRHDDCRIVFEEKSLAETPSIREPSALNFQ